MRVIMRNFSAFFLVYIKQQKVHKANVWGKFIYIPIQSLAICIIWYVISLYNNNVSYVHMVSYYVVCAIMSSAFPYARHTRDVQEDIFSGVFSAYEVIPGGYLLSRLSFFYSWLMIYSIVALPSLFTLICLCNDYESSLFVFINSALFFFLGAIVTFLQWAIVADLSFWTQKILGLVKVYYTVIAFFSGSLVPYIVLPNRFKLLFDILPFKYSAYFPARIVTEGLTTTECIPDVFILIMYIAVFSLIHCWVFSEGRRHYDGGFH